MKKKISILGSTGSIGVNALNVIRNISNNFKIIHLTGNTNSELMIEQSREFNPDSICILLAGIGKDIVPDNFFLTNNYPNPFNPTTSFTFGISSSIEVKISIYNILGQKIFSYSNGKLDAGTYEFNWNGLNQIGDRVTSGIYFYEMEAGNQFRDIKKMTLLK